MVISQSEVWRTSQRHREGRIRARARLNDSLEPRVVCGQHGWWQACPEIGNAAIDPISGSVPHRAYLCQIRRAD